MEPSLIIHTESLVVCENLHFGFGVGDLFDHQEEGFHVSHAEERGELYQILTDDNAKKGAHQMFDKVPRRGSRWKREDINQAA